MNAFAPWVDPQLLILQGQKVPAITRALQVDFHFRHVVRRLVHSLGRLETRAREWDSFLEAGGIGGANPERLYDIADDGGIAADSVLHYLNLFIDDLARIVAIVFANHGTLAKEPDGFSALKKVLEEHKDNKVAALDSLRKLFVDLDQQRSWWKLGFARGAGIRQRLTHYTDMVFFEGSAKPGCSHMSGDIILSTVGGPVIVTEFESHLKDLLFKFCEWLEQLEFILIAESSTRLASNGVPWDPMKEPCPSVGLPPCTVTKQLSSHYLYLPIYTGPQLSQ